MSRNTAQFGRTRVTQKLNSPQVQALTDAMTDLPVRVSIVAALADTSIAVGDLYVILDTLDVYYKNEQT